MIALFATEPPIGTRIVLDDQVYELVQAEPYTRKTDGKASHLLHWDTACPTDGCGKPLRVLSGMSITSLQRRCEDHRVLTKPVKGKRGRRVKIRIEMP